MEVLREFFAQNDSGVITGVIAPSEDFDDIKTFLYEAIDLLHEEQWFTNIIEENQHMITVWFSNDKPTSLFYDWASNYLRKYLVTGWFRFDSDDLYRTTPSHPNGFYGFYLSFT